ncbi:HIT family protein [Maritalea myrionectae]|nr:HIT family protein [Maritalea myrionectae]
MDLDAYVKRSRSGACFICGMIAGDPRFKHHIIYEDDDNIIFLSKYPTLPGYTIVAPKTHIVDLAEELGPTKYLDMQAKIHTVARALKDLFDAERIYILSLGSHQGNSHLHWHVVPLPHGVPYEKQQYYALMAENGILDISDDDMRAIANEIEMRYRALAP